MDGMVEVCQKKLIIRADATTRMGTGHVMRCIALGQAWLDAGRHQAEVGAQKSDVSLASDLCPLTSVVFICAEIPDALAERVKSEGFDLIRIDAALGSPEDLHQTLEVISSFRFQVSSFPSWLITDGYHFNLDYQRGVRAAGLKLLLIDDYNHLPEYEADILLNQNIGAEEIDYRCNPECRKLLGTRYVMLRREFRTLDKRERNFPIIGTHLLVTLGGADPDNVTQKVIGALSQLNIPDLHAKIIVGPANPYIERLRQALSSSTINGELINSVQDMPGLMDWADIAISAAGSTCWELAVLRVPFMTVILAENQEQVARELAQKMGAPCMGWADAGLADRITEQVREWLLTGPVARNRSDFVDRFGIDRILYKPSADAGLDYYKTRLVLRAASMDDAQLLFDWANDPVTRKNSFNPEPILWASHVEWLQKKLSDHSARLFVLELDDVACGHIRYQLEKSGDALLSFVVAPGFRGMGIGDSLVTKSRSVICKQWPSCRVKALTLQGNRASLSIFRKNGFVEERGTFDGKGCSIFYWRCTDHER